MFLLKRKKSKNMSNETPENILMELSTQNLKKILGNNSDIIFKEFLINNNKALPVSLIYVDGLANPSYISDYVLKPIVQEHKFHQAENIKEVIQLIEAGIVYFPSQLKTTDINKVLSGVLTGSSALVFDDCSTAILFDTKGFEKRAITEPTVENVTKGAKDSFVETLRTNPATVRRKIKTQNLMIEQAVIGKQTLTPVAIIYMKGLTNKHIVDELKKRLDGVEVDNVLATGFVEEFVSDNINSSFPQILSTERPDKFCAEIVEGRVGIIIDGIPVAFIVPGTLVQFLQAPEDYSRNWLISSTIRLLRFSVMVLTLILPAFYIAVTSFHIEMIPFRLEYAIANSRKDITFPTFIETLFMLVAFEILFEASLRIPRSIGQAISIVGTIIIGQSAVEAKLVSPAVVVIIAITSTASFVMPNQDFSNALRLWRFCFAS